MAYDLGDTAPLGVTIADTSGTATNAASVVLTITRPDGTVEPSPSVANPTIGHYTCDYVLTQVGIYQVLWSSTNPTTAYGPDAIDVRTPTRAVISLDDARSYLNTTGQTAVDEDDLRDVLAAAVERVDRHIFTDAQRAAGSSLTTVAQVTASQVLAVKVALAYYWITQRPENGPPPGYMTGPNDDTPGSFISLQARLVEILGGETSGAGTAPMFGFDDAPAWPDPPRAVGTYQPIILWR